MTTFEEYLARLPEERRREIEEGAKILMAEEAFWDSLPEAERVKRLEKPKVSYDAASDTLWLKNGRPTARSCEIVKGRVIAFFEADIWYPSAVKIAGAYELLGQFFAPDDAPKSKSLVVKYGDGGKVEKFLNLENLEIHHENLGDYLRIGNGEPPYEGSEIAEDLIVSFAEDCKTPVGVILTPAAELLAPVLAPAYATAPPRLV